jgi:hypothetical protein
VPKFAILRISEDGTLSLWFRSLRSVVHRTSKTRSPGRSLLLSKNTNLRNIEVVTDIFDKNIIFWLTSRPHFLIPLLLDWLPQWLSAQSSCLQIQRSGFDSRHYQILWEVVGLEPGPLSLVSTTEELLQRKSGCYDRANHATSFYPQKLELTSQKRGGRSVSIVRSQTQATEFDFLFCFVTFRVFYPD